MKHTLLHLTLIFCLSSWFVLPTIARTTHIDDCPAPTHIYTENYSVNSAYLRWQYSGTAPTTFTLEIKATNATSWSSIEGITTTDVTVQNLTPSTTYTYRIKSACSPFSTTASVYTSYCGTYASTLEPLSTSARLSWRSALNTTYTLRWRPQGGDWTTVNNLTGDIRPATSIPRFYLSATYSLTNLTPSTIYEWQVEAICGPGFSSWSTSQSFTASCTASFSVSANNIGETTANVIWRLIPPGSPGSLDIQFRPLEPANGSWTSLNGGTYNFYASPPYWFIGLTNLTPATGYQVRLQTQCPDGTSSGFKVPYVFFTAAPPCNGGMATTQSGDWTNPAIWSCNRVPLPSDPIQVLHNVMIPDNSTGRALRVNYSADGKVQLGTGARLLLSQ